MAPSSNPERAELVLRSTVLEEEAAQQISPITLIPPELLCSIFTLLTPPLKSGSSLTIVSSRLRVPSMGRHCILGRPWVLSHVCSHWRALAISLPSLWTSITVFANASPRQLIGSLRSLSRQANVAERSLHLQFDGGWLPLPSFATLSGLALPLLKKLAVSGAGVSSIEHHGLFTNALPLRRVVLATRSREAIQNLVLPCAQLASYKAFYPDAQMHFGNLASAAKLVECDLDFSLPIGEGFTITQLDIVTLPRLRRLAISCPVLLERLVAPALRSLYIVGPVHNALPFLDRSGCTSRLLELTLAQYHARSRHPHARCTQPPAEIVAALTAPERLCLNLGLLAWANFSDALDHGMCPLRSVVLLVGRLRLKAAERRMRAVPGLEVVIMNPNKGFPTLARWRDY
ncbi:hypothetical protein B0H14DRAFT_2590378 [Mycena olivaceomarginata]|nr:hypothetical protein B0H14DRAFT_2590378 [Mycena olivaceomarginata]